MPSGGSQASGYSNRHEAQNSHGLYVQDSFRWTKRLTVNYGLRWDYFGVPSEKNNLFYQLTPANGGTLTQVGAGGGPSSLYNKDYNNFAPRVAFAYDLAETERLSFAPDGACSTMRFRRTSSSATFPTTAPSVPDPPTPVLVWPLSDSPDLSGNTIAPGVPVYGAASPLGQLLRRRSQHPHALHPELEPEHSAPDHQQDHGADRIRRSQGNQALPLPRHQPAHPGADYGVRSQPMRDLGADCPELLHRGLRRSRRRQLQRPAHQLPQFLLREPGRGIGQLHLQRACRPACT